MLVYGDDVGWPADFRAPRPVRARDIRSVDYPPGYRVYGVVEVVAPVGAGGRLVVLGGWERG